MPHDHFQRGHNHGHSHGQSHGHNHGHSHAAGLSDRPLIWAVVINLALTVAQIVGGYLADSMALIADGVHNLSDALALVLAFGARRLARRPASEGMTFGWGRAEIVAAFVNQIALIAISVWLAIEAVGRLANPPDVAGGLVMALAGLALVIDLGTAALTMRLARDSLNIRAAFLHNLADAGVSLAVLIGGGLILAFGWTVADPVLTILISAVILWHVIADLGPVMRMLMLGAPPGFDTPALRAAISAHPGVEDLHHLHLWQIDERRMSAEMHLVVTDPAQSAAVLHGVKALLARDFGINHSTIQIETAESGCTDTLPEDNQHDASPDHDAPHDHDHDHKAP